VNARPSNRENDRGTELSLSLSLPLSRFSALHGLTRNYNSRVIFDRAFPRLFCALQKLIAEDVVAYVYLYIALSKSRLMSNVSLLQHLCRRPVAQIV
jgi:hypothetical protein